MKLYFPTFLISVILLTAPSCATIQQTIGQVLDLSGLSGDSAGGDSQEYDDPVTAAAMQLRKPASSAGDEPTEPRVYTPSDTISYGMAPGEVAAAWGEPANIDTAGDSRDGNQRWTYYSGLSSPYGLGDRRIVYFENGRVVGWKK